MEEVFAQSLTLGEGGATVQGPVQFGSIGAIISKIYPIVLAFAGFGLLLMIIAAGFALLTSAGDSKKTEQAKQQLTNAIIGFIIIFGAVFIVRVVGRIFGITVVNTIF